MSLNTINIALENEIGNLDSTLLTTLNQAMIVRESLDPQNTGKVLPNYMLQSATYNPVKNRVVLGFNLYDTQTDSLLVEMTQDFSEVLAGYEYTGTTNGLYHCNDMTYCSKTEKIYVALCDVPGIGIINATTMQKETVVYFNSFNNPCFTQISYDAENDVLYLGNSYSIYIGNISSDGTLNITGSKYISSEGTPLPIGVPHNFNSNLQGSNIINGEFARLWSMGEVSRKSTASRIDFPTFSEGEPARFIDLPTRHRDQEAEAFVTVGYGPGQMQCLLSRDGSNILVEKISLGDYNFITSYLSADKEVNINSNNVVSNAAVADRFYSKVNEGNLLDFALSLPSGVHAVQNTQSATPNAFKYMMALVVKNEVGNRCAVYVCDGNGILCTNNYFGYYYDDGTPKWQGWYSYAGTAKDFV